MIKDSPRINDATNCITLKQAGKLLAFNKLANVAKYLNDNEFKESLESYFIVHDITDNSLHVFSAITISYGTPIFKTKELAERAIEILGEETVRLALSQV